MRVFVGAFLIDLRRLVVEELHKALEEVLWIGKGVDRLVVGDQLRELPQIEHHVLAPPIGNCVFAETDLRQEREQHCLD